MRGFKARIIGVTKCPACKEVVRVTSKGKIWMHHVPHGKYYRPCEQVGKFAKNLISGNKEELKRQKKGLS